MRTMPVATSIVMDVVSFAWSRAVSLRAGALKHTMRSIQAYNDQPLPRCGWPRRPRAATSKGRCSGRSSTRASKAGVAAPPVMSRKRAGYRRRNQLDPALRERQRISGRSPRRLTANSSRANPGACAEALTDRVVDVTPTLDGFDVAVHRGEVRAHRHDRYVAPPSLAPRRNIAGPLVVPATCIAG